MDLHIYQQGDEVLLANSLQDSNLNEVKHPVIKMSIFNQFFINMVKSQFPGSSFQVI